MNSIINKFHFCCLLLLGAVFLIFSGCNEKPTDVGMPLLFDTVTVYPLSSGSASMITGQRTFQYFDTLYNNGSFLVGATKELKAAGIVRFVESLFPDSLKDIDISTIKSLKLSLLPSKYTYGDLASNNLSFKVYRMKSGKENAWSLKDSWESLIKSDGTSDRFTGASIGQWSGVIPIVDSNSVISVELTDYQMIKDWTKDQMDSTSIWGLCIVPDNNSTVIREFPRNDLQSSYPVPRLTMIYRNPSRTKDDTLIVYSTDYKTLLKSAPADTSLLAFQGSVGIRSQLYFDLSFLNIPPNTSIYKAQLELNYIPEKLSYGSLPMDTVIEAGLFLSDSVWLNPNISYYAKLYGTRFVFPKIISAVEFWLRKGSGKGSLVLLSPIISRHARLDRMSFYGLEQSDPEKRPKLIIIYSKRPY